MVYVEIKCAKLLHIKPRDQIEIAPKSMSILLAIISKQPVKIIHFMHSHIHVCVCTMVALVQYTYFCACVLLLGACRTYKYISLFVTTIIKWVHVF